VEDMAMETQETLKNMHGRGVICSQIPQIFFFWSMSVCPEIYAANEIDAYYRALEILA
jgi:hypothetical protein